ncbi:MAG: VOC family protein [Bacteroidota bacterium]
MQTHWPDGIDHLIYTAPDLKTGMDAIEAQLGMRPVIGGQHPLWGTHNALLALGKGIYLEVVAPDPSLAVGERGLWLEQYYALRPGLRTWAFRKAAIQAARQIALQNQIAIGAIEKGQRQKPDASLLRWQLTDPYKLAFEGALPFLIDWGNSQHPSLAIPSVGELLSLEIIHPQDSALREALQKLKINIALKAGNQYKLSASIQTAGGIIKLETPN